MWACLLAVGYEHGAKLGHVQAQLLLQALQPLHLLCTELAAHVLLPLQLPAQAHTVSLKPSTGLIEMRKNKIVPRPMSGKCLCVIPKVCKASA